MQQQPPLVGLLSNSAAQYPDNIAVSDCQYGSLSYARLDALSQQVARRLQAYGVTRHSRVGLWMTKSMVTVTALFGILKCGASYVPTDPMGPPERNAFIFKDCAISVLLIEPSLIARLDLSMAAGRFEIMETIEPLTELGAQLLLVTLRRCSVKEPAPKTLADSRQLLAYILYTSGSTGKPKGVPHTHQSALSFINWCSDEFSPVPNDKFSSHAPFHFDLSILDIYVPIKHGACICIIGEELGKQPAQLASFIAASKITFWYSTPSILRMLTEFGHLEQHDFKMLHTVCFAGEVYPMNQLRQLYQQWPGPDYYNLYGPTETNVCTYYKVTGHDMENRQESVPIGRLCSDDRSLIVDDNQQVISDEQCGHLYISGGSVMKHYWNDIDKTELAFYCDAQGQRWYKTGDIVHCNVQGELIYQGRSDRMVKKRGFRVELGEIESALYRHQGVSEVAVIALPDGQGHVMIYALLSPKDKQVRLSIIQLKQYCSEVLPYYMVPDRFKLLEKLPKTATDKIDYQQLQGSL
jgi:amino acid adenylation domain-containing protein